MSVVLSICIIPHHEPAGFTSVMIKNSWAIHTSVAPIVKLANYLDRGPGDGLSPYFGIFWYLAFRHITTRASKQASEAYDQDRAVLDALK